jgi:hypothetical protein
MKKQWKIMNRHSIEKETAIWLGLKSIFFVTSIMEMQVTVNFYSHHDQNEEIWHYQCWWGYKARWYNYLGRQFGSYLVK